MVIGVLVSSLLFAGIASSQQTTYDYIVVGSGPSGIVMADRLSEAGKSVLLIERGGPSTALTGGTDTPPWSTRTNLTRFDIPGMFDTMFSDVSPLAGCLVGGGAAINGMQYWYPPDAEYSTSNGWPSGWQSVSTYVDKLKARLPSTDIPSKDGKRYLTQIHDVIKSLLDKQGYSELTVNNSPNTKDKIYGFTAFPTQGGKRTGPMDTYLKTARARSNFKLVTNTNVLAVVRNGAQITGVRTDNSALGTNGIVSLTSKGRVVLSAGVFGTAKILFQSGIGPSDMLSITASNPTSSQYMPPSSQYINLPVGMNAKDSPSITLTFAHSSVPNYSWGSVWSNPPSADASQYASQQAGILAGNSYDVSFWRPYTGSDGIKRYVQGSAHGGGFGFASGLFTVYMYITQGLTSTGRIGIDSSLRGVVLKNPWLADQAEKTVMTNAVTDVLSTYQQVSGLQLISPSSGTLVSTHVSNTVGGSNHWTSTTRIGTSSSTSVVDSNTKVWNTNNLFIVDAGIHPGMPMSNPFGSFMVMAELAAAKILGLAGGP
ncbi:GMC oxidoreductase [Rhizoctonia solani]|uniref:GMC oxidoreductase n=1 Tax=Rhizoctonia solani TaxID=456999 RepID=A0A8H8P3D4_9AGAM|nr:GMC oxidoreductase [Rhizoctonia solani]QRW24931.1 GMC oxidoreductase [Rhizoctonia solani]